MAEAFDSEENNGGGIRGEVDTSAPFESVKEAVTRFGGVGFWKPKHKHPPATQNENGQVFDAAKAEDQLANDLILKERETLQVLKELEATKATLEELKLKLHKEATTVEHEEPGEGNDDSALQPQSDANTFSCPSSAPGFILMELKQAKLNLTRTTNDLADLRATVETYKKMIETERFSLEKTRQRSSKISSLEEDVDLPMELQRLTSETEEFKKAGELAKIQVLRTMNQITEMKMMIKTAEIRLTCARKLKEAAKVSDALARSELKSLSKSQAMSEGEGVTLSFDEYFCLKMKAREAEEASNRRVNEAMVQVEQAEISKSEILNKVEEATEEVKNSKRVLEEALSKVEAANGGKLKAEEALRKWRSDHGQRRKSTVQNATKFKNSSCRTNSRLFDVNGAHLGGNASGPVMRPTMSIGQILSRKLLLTEEYSEKRKVSLAQMLSKPTNGGGGGDGGKRRSGKRKKFGLGRISFLVAKPSKKKKKHSLSSRLSCGVD